MSGLRQAAASGGVALWVWGVSGVLSGLVLRPVVAAGAVGVWGVCVLSRLCAGVPLCLFDADGGGPLSGVSRGGMRGDGRRLESPKWPPGFPALVHQLAEELRVALPPSEDLLGRVRAVVARPRARLNRRHYRMRTPR